MSPVETPNLKAPSRNEPAGATRSREPQNHWQVVMLPVERIAPSPYQPRLLFDADEMADLAASVKEHGVQQPILVRPAKSEGEKKTNGAPHYELVAGERRLRASREAGRKHIPAIVRELDDRTAAEIALTENVQRSNLSVIEEARGYKQLMLKFRMTEERISKKVGKSVATIQATMKLLALPESVQQLMANRKLSASHGHALLPLASHERICESVAHYAVTNGVTATALSQAPLPNGRELAQKKWLQELDYRTKFDWRSECASCPHKAYVASGYASYCLKPNEWHKKQEAAIERQKDEASQAMQAARDALDGDSDVTQLPPGSYRDLTHTQIPAGCTEHCACRRNVPDPSDPTKTVSVCLNLERLQELKKAEQQAHEDARRTRYRALWAQATDALRSEVETDTFGKISILLTSLVLRACGRYGSGDDWGALARSVGVALEVPLPWSELFESHAEAPALATLNAALERTDENAPNGRKLLLFAASLLLADEAQGAVRWASETPRLAFVLGLKEATQPELTGHRTEDVPPRDGAKMEEGDMEEPQQAEAMSPDEEWTTDWPDNQPDDDE